MFKEKHVDRVISFEPWEGWGFFMLEANRQQFYPRWGLSSQTDWEVVKATGLVPEKEMLGARFVGWSPVMDIQNMWKPTTKPRWSRLRLCDGIYAQAGIRPDGPLAEVFSLALCDGLLDVAALGAREHGVLDRVSFPRAVSAVAWQSSFFPTTRVSVARPDGVIAVRPASWDAAHSRFVYTGRQSPAAP
jgi:predicted DNA-binding transcriptional regulator AlpA